MKSELILICFACLSLCVLTWIEAKRPDLDSFAQGRLKPNRTKLPKNVTRDRYKSQTNFRATSDQARFIHDTADVACQYYKEVVNGSNMTSRGFDFALPIVAFANQTLCPYNSLSNTKCNASYKYQSIDGSCNNLKNPLYGRNDLPYKRFLPPAYADNFDLPRMSSSLGGPLPNVRVLSLNISPPITNQRLEINITHLFVVFGQFLTHDLTASSAITDDLGFEKSCPCGSKDPDCALSVSWPSVDPFLNQTCMKTTRSSAAFPFTNCTYSYREQLNLLTPFIDGNQIYGMDSARASQLRTFVGGQLATSKGVSGDNFGLKNRTYLPLSNDTCSLNGNLKCFLAGEFRTSENLGLASIHTLFNREHNRIAAALAALNPSWDDNTLYLETRRIVLAVYQNVVFGEWLPVATGNTNLKPLSTNAYYTGYDSSINPQIYNEFATAAFRMGHSMVRQTLNRCNAQQVPFRPPRFYNLEDNIFQSEMAYDTTINGPPGSQPMQGLNAILSGYLSDTAWKFGSFGNQLQNNLFQLGTPNKDGQQAVDLLAMNINRGRDHGLQPFVYYVNKCLNSTVSQWGDLRWIFNGQVSSKLQSLYKSVWDVDLYVGGLLEIKWIPNTAVGTIFGCIINSQFSDLKNGDRFYFENGPETTASAFTLDQLAQIKKVTIAGLVCNNFDITNIQPNAFFNTGNPNVNCSTLVNQLDLSKWKV